MRCLCAFFVRPSSTVVSILAFRKNTAIAKAHGDIHSITGTSLKVLQVETRYRCRHTSIIMN
jgi:hypothetical protein